MVFKSSEIILAPRTEDTLQARIEKHKEISQPEVAAANDQETAPRSAYTDHDYTDMDVDDARNKNSDDEDDDDDDDSMEKALSALNVEVTINEGDQPIKELAEDNGDLDEDFIDEVINEKIAEDIRKQDISEEFLEMEYSEKTPVLDYCCNLCQYSATSSSGLWYLKKRNTKNTYYPCSMCKFVNETLASHSRKAAAGVDYVTADGNAAQRPAAGRSLLLVNKKATQDLSRRKSAEVMMTATSSGKGNLVDFSAIKHTITGVHPCYECNFVGGNEHALKKHLSLKHANRSSTCPACAFKTEDLSLLKLHVQTNHQGERFPCHQCNFFATRKSTLKTHIASIHQGVKYPCDLCSYAATQKSALRRHLKTVHKKEMSIYSNF